jgi:glycosyltransferase involved in cell wall biosynthesis
MGHSWLSSDDSLIRFDARWIGDHGIGRFAREIQSRWPGLVSARLRGRPSDATDCLKTWLWLVGHPGKLLFSPGYNAPLFCQRRCIITVHDLNHIDAPIRKSALKRLYYRCVLKRACQNARLVFTVSEYSSRRILEWSGALPERVINVGNGVSDVFCPKKTASTDHDAPYFLSVSNRKPHKNERRLLEAFRMANLPAHVRLLITGEATPAQHAWLTKHKLEQRIVFLGRVHDEQLADYYRHALGLVFVSLYEGFGLPALEAMACGAPVIVSEVTSLPEVVDTAGLCVNPREIGEIRQAIERLWRDRALRDALSTAGLKRARAFSWDKVAGRIREYLEHVCLDARQPDFH